jgi:hypothetical protein
VKTAAFKAWLAANYSPNSAATHYSGTKRVEEAYGDLDALYDSESLGDVIASLNYSTADAARGRPNPSKVQGGTNLYTNLASFKSAVRCYCKFRGSEAEIASEAVIELAASNIIAKKADKQFDLEAQLQEVLRDEIDQLESGLVVIDGGSERSVNSGEIDILARAGDGSLVVIELKRALARRDTIGQITGYMGDLMTEEPGENVRGIIVAADFDKSCLGAARAIPMLMLKRYRFNFEFEEVSSTSSSEPLTTGTS